MRGGEKCLEVFCDLYPSAPIYTLLALQEKLSATILSHPIHTSFIQKLPFAEKRYRYYLPLFPTAIESFDKLTYPLILSSSHAVAKGVKIAPKSLHISYVHTPMRYVWDMFDSYFSVDHVGAMQRTLISNVAKRIRRWDVKSNSRVHHFIANSDHVRKRILKHYHRDSVVIHPPVDTKRFTEKGQDYGYYLLVSALVPYKRVDLAIEAFNELKLPLRIVGDGPEFLRLKMKAKDHISFHGWIDDASLAGMYANATALIFPGEEDFGITPLEAMASGRPVIAFNVGGALETVVDGETGVFFPQQTSASLIEAVRKFQQMQFDENAIRMHAAKFDTQIFREKIDSYVREMWEAWDG